MTHHDHDHDHDYHHGKDHHGVHGDSHEHNHNHGHHHHGHHDSEAAGPMSERQKLAKLLEHWVSHNGDHASNYKQWAEKADGMNLSDVARMLEEAAELTDAISERFLKAKGYIEKNHGTGK